MALAIRIKIQRQYDFYNVFLKAVINQFLIDYTYIHTYIHIYIYIYRERER